MESLKQRMQKLQLQKDPYQILGCELGADFNIVRKSYRNLALKYHPDRNKQQQAADIFLNISRAYQFLQKQENRQLYASHMKGLRQQKQRIQAMNQQRKKIIQNLKRRQEQKNKIKQDLANQLKKRKDFFDRMDKQQEQRQQLRRQINKQMNPKQFYDRLSGVEISWGKGLAFTQSMLRNYFQLQAKIQQIKIEQKRRKATMIFASFQKAGEVVENFRHPLIDLSLVVQGSERTRLLNALQKRKTNIDLSLSTTNIQRLKEMLNRNSNFYLSNTLVQ